MKKSITRNLKTKLIAATIALIAMAGTTTVIFNSTNTSGIKVNATYVTDWSEEKDNIDDYFEAFDFDEKNYFNSMVQDEETSKAQLVKNPDGSISIIQKKQIADNLSFSSFGVANADSNVIYPGALLKADEGLVTGNPAPIKIGRREINIGVPNAKMNDDCDSYVTVNPSNASAVNSAISKLVKNFRESTDFAAQVKAKIEKVESDEQIKAKMNFSEEMWGNLKIDASADYQNKKQAVVVDVSQIFYTISADVQTSADLFPDGMKLDRIKKYIKNTDPAVMVSSIDYGKRVVACIQTNDTSFDLKAAVEASGLGGKVKGSAEAEYTEKLKNCSINLFVTGGSSETAGTYFKDISIDKLIDVASSNTKYDGYAVPVSYTTRWAHDGRIATAKYFGYAWKTVTTKQLTQQIPMCFKLFKGKVSKASENVLEKGMADIYGKRIIGINEDGSYIKSDMQLIKHLELDYETKENFNLPADVILDSVKVVFDYEAPDTMTDPSTNIVLVREKRTESQRTIYFQDVFRKNDHPITDFDPIEIRIAGAVNNNDGSGHTGNIVGTIYAPVQQKKLYMHEKNYIGFGFSDNVGLDNLTVKDQ